MKSLHIFMTSILILSFNSACQKASEVTTRNLVTAKDAYLQTEIGDSQNRFSILANGKLQQLLADKKLSQLSSAVLEASKENKDGLASKDVTAVNTSASAQSLVLGYPLELVGQQVVFGGVITKVSDKEDEGLGGLKMTDLSPVHVKSVLDKAHQQLVFIGCEEKCNEESVQKVLLSIPVLGVDTKNNFVYLDLSALGTKLDIIQKLDPQGKETGLIHESSELQNFDFSLNTLVFDVDSVMKRVELNTDKQEEPTEQSYVTITARWYIKLSSGFNPAFTSRKQTEGIGYFLTSRSNQNFITRFSTTNYEQNAVAKYYVKNVPDQYKKAFQAGFDEWNTKLKSVLGRNMFEYEFIDSSDPRHALLIPGDIRYSILEWDLDNLAGYGGLGPSIANQFTGELMSANVLIQGPTIEKLYKAWFKVQAEAKKLDELGAKSQAEKLKADFHRSIKQIVEHKTQTQVQFGNHLSMTVHSEDPRKQDPLFMRMDFEDLPKGFDYDNYMYGYFIDMVAHELGHNLGLRHNFRGNLGTDDSMTVGSVSRSIMEYLGRAFRHLDRVGEYDVMAIAYGYKGIAPKHTDWFCTDDDVVDPNQPKNNAECSSSDATSDPYGYFEKQLDKVMRLLTASDSNQAPEWTVEDLNTQLATYVSGLLNYAVSAPFTADSWKHFFGKGDRPAKSMAVSAYVLDRLNQRVCSPDFEDIVEKKETEAAKQKTLKNIDDMRKVATKIIGAYTQPIPVLNPKQFPCL